MTVVRITILSAMVTILLLALLVTTGCTIENRGGSISLLEPPPPVVVETTALTLDEPVIRVLETFGGRIRLIVQDPITRRYRVAD